jgi:hypothetical protein
MTRTAAVILLAFFARPARAVDLKVQFPALERLLGEQVFTQDGRRYVHGGKNNKCNFAYLEKPHVEGADGKLRFHAKFTGQTALNMFGQCVGVGDAFDVEIAAIPVFKDGNIGLSEVAVSSKPRDGFYIRRVCAAMAGSLARDFRYPLAAATKTALENPGAQPGYPRELRAFRVTGIRVTNDALVLEMDFELTVK